MSHTTTDSPDPATIEASAAARKTKPAAAVAGTTDLSEAARDLAERRRIIEEIRGFNPKAEPTFLAGFTTESLQEYLEHLRYARHKSVRLRGWLQLRCVALEEARRQLQLRKAA